MNTSTTTPTTVRRFDRASWLTVAFVVAFTAICVLLTALVLREPGDGCLLDLNASTVYACVGDWATPLLPGDRILSVAGIDLVEGNLIRRSDERLAGLAEAAALPYTIERAGERLDLTVPLGRLDGPGLACAFVAGVGHYAGGWLFVIFLGSAFIFALAPRSRPAQLLLVAGSSLAMVTTLVWTGESIGTNLLAPAWLYASFIVVATFWGWLLMPTLLLLVLSFPRQVWPFSRWPRATVLLLYGAPLAALAATMLTEQAEIFFASLGLGAFAFLATTIVVTVHAFWRVRDPIVRAQTAWLSLGLLVGIGIWPLLFVAGDVLPNLEANPELAWVEIALQVVTSAIFVLCLGIAITRYHLFDIAVVVNRALVYTLLTTTLAALYFGGVVLVQGILRAVTGQESDLAIVASTLVVAACFQPLRGRIQSFIDRRFYRRKYNAALILAAYGARLRAEVDLTELTDDLVRVSRETVEPATVSLWLREPSTQRGVDIASQ